MKELKLINLRNSFLCTVFICFSILSGLSIYDRGIQILYTSNFSEEDIRVHRMWELYGKYVNFTIPTVDILLNVTHDPYFDKKINDMSMEPIPFLPTYKNPCWFESLPNAAVYSKNIWSKLKPSVSNKLLRTMPSLLRQRKYHEFGWRLRCLPYFYIAGVSKCGTTDLFAALNRHPDVVESPLKETMFWNRIRLNETVNNPDDIANLLYHELPRINKVPVPRPTKDYIEIYDLAAEKIREGVQNAMSSTGQPFQYHRKVMMDATPSYFYEYDGWTKLDVHEGLSEPKYTTPNLIHKLTPHAKIVLMFRNPTDRLFSDYKFFSRNGNVDTFHRRAAKGIKKMEMCLANRTVRSCIYDRKLSDHEMQVRIRVGMYQPYLEDWLRVFPRENVFISRLEDYSSDPEKVLKGIFSFLGLSKSHTIRTNKEVRNSRPGSRGLKKGMRKDTQLMLNNFYKKWNHRLSDMLNDTKYNWDI